MILHNLNVLSKIILASLVLAALPGCVTGQALRARAEEIQETVDRIHPRAYLCAPKELAIAESNVEFGRHELSQGDFVRAREHLDNAEESARVADTISQPDVCNLSPSKVVTVEKVEPVELPKPVPKPQDRDGDGYLDDVDQCPDEPEDFDGFQDDDGCPDLDNDNDGIPDSIDQCPNVPEDFDGFRDDDGCPDLDNDGDAIPDSQDKCPNEPEDYDGFQDDDGCPDPDNDNDGVSDLNDLCPDQPENYNGNKDDDGCPDKDPLAKIEGDTIKLNQKVFFKTNKSEILSQSYPLLDEVAQILREHPKIKVRIEGHTDSRGRDSYNKKLSQERASSVRQYLFARGIDLNRMDSVGYGEERPIDDNNTKVGRANNRRVEIHITSK